MALASDLVGRVKKALAGVSNPDYRAALELGIKEYEDGTNPNRLVYLLMLKRYPVSIREFILSKSYLNMGTTIYPNVIDYLEELNNPDGDRLGMKYYEAVYTGGIGCVDRDTEYLTPTGWRAIGDYSGGPVAQYHEDGSISYVDSPEYVIYPCDKFYHLKTKYGLDQALSPEHRVVFRQPKSGKLDILSAEEVVTRHNNSKKGFSGRFMTTFSVGGDCPLSDDQLRVMVMTCADGYIRNWDTGLCYLHLKKNRKIERAIQLLDSAGIPFSIGDKSNGYTWISYYPPITSKRFSDFAWDYPSAALRVIVEEAPYWDGRAREVCTTLKEEADFFSYAGSASGYRTIVNFDERSYAPTYVIRFNPGSETTLQGVPKTPIGEIPSSDGKKYCFHVPTGMLVLRRNGRVFITGNTAKTTQALITTAYQIYILSCFKSPHLALEQDQSSEILFIFQSLHGGVSRDVDYRRFRAMVEVSPYFTEVFPFRKDLESRLIFPHRIEVVPVSGEVTATIGQNVFGGLMDEVNFMDVIADSKRKVDGGLYDQAKELYNSLSSRRSSRFMQFGKMPGIFCLSSSKRYPGQFTDVKAEQAKKDPGIWYYDKVVWDVKGRHNFSGKWFKVFCGDFSRKPRILEPGDSVSEDDQHLVVSIPREYYNKFENDIYDALREIAGVSTLATVPYISSVESVAACFSKKYKSVFSRTECDFDKEGLELFVNNLEDPTQPRAVHIDLGLTSDAAGMVIGHVKEFVLGDDEDGTESYMPVIRIDGSLRVKPPKNGEINFKRIRKIVTILKSMGVNIIWVSFDSYQSVDSIQILKSKGFRCGQVSMDKTSNPYDMTKTCILDGRLQIPVDNHLKREIIQLERTSKGKIDHPDIGSKDVADALAGVVHTLSTRPYIWAKHGVAPSAAFKQSMKKDKEDES